MREHFEQYAFWLSMFVAIASTGTTIAVIVYTSKVISSVETKLIATENKDKAQDIQILQAFNAAHEKELACRDMVYAVNLAKKDYRYCK